MTNRLPQAHEMKSTAQNVIQDKLSEVSSSDLVVEIRKQIQKFANEGRFRTELSHKDFPDLKYTPTRSAVEQLLINGGYDVRVYHNSILVSW